LIAFLFFVFFFMFLPIIYQKYENSMNEKNKLYFLFIESCVYCIILIIFPIDRKHDMNEKRNKKVLLSFNPLEMMKLSEFAKSRGLAAAAAARMIIRETLRIEDKQKAKVFD